MDDGILKLIRSPETLTFFLMLEVPGSLMVLFNHEPIIALASAVAAGAALVTRMYMGGSAGMGDLFFRMRQNPKIALWMFAFPNLMTLVGRVIVLVGFVVFTAFHMGVVNRIVVGVPIVGAMVLLGWAGFGLLLRKVNARQPHLAIIATAFFSLSIVLPFPLRHESPVILEMMSQEAMAFAAITMALILTAIVTERGEEECKCLPSPQD